MRDQFLLDPNVIFLNHGSFGACPAPVFARYQQWQRELERQPVAFLGRRYQALLDDARTALADYVNVAADALIFVPNATAGINLVARSLDLKPGDEVLATDHEYGAIDRTWDFVCQKAGAHYRRQRIPTPITDAEAVIEHLWAGVTPRTRVIAISHITSPTALIFPVAEICCRAREAGILTVIDGAHVPGQMPLDIAAIDPDFYTGNCHKWLCTPKGAALLYARRDHHPWLEPLIISWGYELGAGFVQQNQWQGTQDIAAYLTVPAAITWQHEQDWPAVRARCHELAIEARQRIHTLTGLPFIAPADWFAQMFTVPVPVADIDVLKTRLYDTYRIEVPGITWDDRAWLRVSVQGYNTAADLDRLVDALARELAL